MISINNQWQNDISLAAVDRYAEQVRTDFDVPGLGVALVKDNAVIMAKGYGVRGLEDDRPATADSLFGIASISKSFTALALGMLVDEGKLRWDDRVTEHIPTFQLYDAYATREFTVLDLLVHHCGLPTISGGAIWYGSDFSRDEIVRRIRYLRPVTSFRSEFAYQNITYLVAGQIIPAVTGMSWDEFVTARIFAPLGMDTSSTDYTTVNDGGNVFQPHCEVDGRLQVVKWRNHDNVGPAASINTTVRELANYARLLLNGGEFDGQQLYSVEIARDLWTPQTPRPISAETLDGAGVHTPQFHSAYALGWGIQDYCGQRRVSHSGGIDGLRSLLTMIPDANLGIIVFANAEVPAPWALTNFILDLYAGAADAGWYDVLREEWAKIIDKWRQQGPSTPVPDTTPSLAIAEYAGVYQSAIIGDIIASFEDERLMLTFPHTPSFTAELIHWHFDTFRLNWQDPVVPDGLATFVLDSQGQISEMRLDQPNLLDVDFFELHPITRRSNPATE